jgi:hypothetical protein
MTGKKGDDELRVKQVFAALVEIETTHIDLADMSLKG